MPLAYSESDFAAALAEDDAGHRLPYRLLRPGQLQPGVRYPLVLLLHGAGERGTDNRAQLGNGAAPLFGNPLTRLSHPCFVVLPQCPPEARWVEVDWGAPAHRMPEEPSIPLRQALALVTRLCSELPVDTSRVYAVGLSMGGFGVWDALCRAPELFAAGIAVCGGGDVEQAPRLRSLPIWAFHGARDAVVLPERSRAMIDALRRSGASPRFTEYPDVAHDAWARAFAEPELVPWLMAQRRGQSG